MRCRCVENDRRPRKSKLSTLTVDTLKMVLIEQEPKDSKETVATTTTTTNENGDASDGFETASERDVTDEGNREDQPVPLNDDELKQKALAEANEVKLEGNKLFGEGKYEMALLQYEVALRAASGPESTQEAPAPEMTELRSICHSNRGICFLKLGKYEDSIKECTKALELNPTYMKALIRRAEAHEKLEHFEEAIADLKKILELDPSNNQARRTVICLEPLAAEKREKMKEEMIGKLKEMGNSILGHFGMSVDNFKAVKDPKTGAYSMSFQK